MKIAPGAKLVFLLAGAATFASAASAQTESVIYSFPENSGLYSRLYEDDTGALYGGEYYGPANKGSIYKLTEKKGAWTERPIFKFDGRDGENPFGGLEQDAAGILYGTTTYGGNYNFGTVFTLTPSAGKLWSGTVILDLDGQNGEEPESTPLIGKTGAIFATANAGGTANCGTAFQLAQSGGNWTETTLYSFRGGSDGCGVVGPMHQGAEEGTMFGITTYGGSRDDGTVFELKEVHGVWKEHILHEFTGGADGAYPTDIDVNADGNLYGVTSYGGTNNNGVLFGLAQVSKWQYTVIHAFEGGEADASAPVGIHFDRSNTTIYGTSSYGGSDGGGTVFQFVGSGNSWYETILHSFGTSAYDGLYPQSRPIVDQTTGFLYGTTLDGGQHGGGTVWTVTP